MSIAVRGVIYNILTKLTYVSTCTSMNKSIAASENSVSKCVLVYINKILENAFLQKTVHDGKFSTL